MTYEFKIGSLKTGEHKTIKKYRYNLTLVLQI